MYRKNQWKQERQIRGMEIEYTISVENETTVETISERIISRGLLIDGFLVGFVIYLYMLVQCATAECEFQTLCIVVRLFARTIRQIAYFYLAIKSLAEKN